jgi:hypothetical protein
LNPKEDYQVKQALLSLKSNEIFKRNVLGDKNKIGEPVSEKPKDISTSL